MPMHKVTTSDFALEGEVTCAGVTRRVWAFRAINEVTGRSYFVLAIEKAACLSFIPGEREVTGLDLVSAGCDLMLAESVLALLHETFPPDQSTDPHRVIENRPIAGNQTPTQ